MIWETVLNNLGYLLSAFTGAVFALILKWAREWLRRPQLSMEIDLSALKTFRVIDAMFEVWEKGAEIILSKEIRLRIHNTGGTPAEYCEAKIEPLNERGESLFDPSILHWVRRFLEPEIKPENTFAPIVINVKDHEFLAMIVLYQKRIGNIESIHLQTASHRPFVFKAKTNYKFKVTVFAKNHNPISKTFSLFWDGSWDGFDADSVKQISS